MKIRVAFRAWSTFMVDACGCLCLCRVNRLISLLEGKFLEVGVDKTGDEYEVKVKVKVLVRIRNFPKSPYFRLVNENSVRSQQL